MYIKNTKKILYCILTSIVIMSIICYFVNLESFVDINPTQNPTQNTTQNISNAVNTSIKIAEASDILKNASDLLQKNTILLSEKDQEARAQSQAQARAQSQAQAPVQSQAQAPVQSQAQAEQAAAQQAQQLLEQQKISIIEFKKEIPLNIWHNISLVNRPIYINELEVYTNDNKLLKDTDFSSIVFSPEGEWSVAYPKTYMVDNSMNTFFMSTSYPTNTITFTLNSPQNIRLIKILNSPDFPNGLKDVIITLYDSNKNIKYKPMLLSGDILEHTYQLLPDVKMTGGSDIPPIKIA